jgi:hypothetical protein
LTFLPFPFFLLFFIFCTFFAETSPSLLRRRLQRYKATPRNDRLTALRVACLHFSVSLHKSSLKYAGIPASDLYKLTKNLTAQSTYNHCAVLP